MNKNTDIEFINIIEPIIINKEFNKLRNIDHHGITRFEHSMRVAIYTYKITKFLHLNYEEATIAALLHDFFTEEVKEKNALAKLRQHPNYAVINATKYFDLSNLQIDIIKTHMFPVTFTPPKYLESWIVDLIDDVSAVYERAYSTKKQLGSATTFMFLFILSIFKIR